MWWECGKTATEKRHRKAKHGKDGDCSGRSSDVWCRRTPKQRERTEFSFEERELACGTIAPGVVGSKVKARGKRRAVQKRMSTGFGQTLREPMSPNCWIHGFQDDRRAVETRCATPRPARSEGMCDRPGCCKVEAQTEEMENEVTIGKKFWSSATYIAVFKMANKSGGNRSKKRIPRNHVWGNVGGDFDGRKLNKARKSGERPRREPWFVRLAPCLRQSSTGSNEPTAGHRRPVTKYKCEKSRADIRGYAVADSLQVD
ncbi:hypothetical protein DFH06DRAFT_1370674 [Mycena polygramma]|nr:hypothetical protein DFH06DRAFT_1370674 [Mycena polygramma]